MGFASIALRHFTELGTLLGDMLPLGIELYSHQYDAAAFGGFVVVLGTEHQRVRFTWDGKDFVLAIAIADVQNASGTCAWVHDADVSLPGGEGVFAEIASEACSLLERGSRAV
jgi:hypothetical protein